MTLPLLAAIAVSCLGAWVSWQVRAGSLAWWWIYGPALLSATVWALLARSAGRLGLAAVLFDVAVAGAYLGVFVALGEPWRWWHAVGAALAVVGCALMAR